MRRKIFHTETARQRAAATIVEPWCQKSLAGLPQDAPGDNIDPAEAAEVERKIRELKSRLGLGPSASRAEERQRRRGATFQLTDRAVESARDSATI